MREKNRSTVMRRRERESVEELDEKERTVLDLGYKETNYHSRQMEIEDDTMRTT